MYHEFWKNQLYTMIYLIIESVGFFSNNTLKSETIMSAVDNQLTFIEMINQSMLDHYLKSGSTERPFHPSM